MKYLSLIITLSLLSGCGLAGRTLGTAARIPKNILIGQNDALQDDTVIAYSE